MCLLNVIMSMCSRCVDADYRGVDWYGVDYRGVDCSDVDWHGVDWHGVDWHGVDWYIVLCLVGLSVHVLRFRRVCVFLPHCLFWCFLQQFVLCCNNEVMPNLYKNKRGNIDVLLLNKK